MSNYIIRKEAENYRTEQLLVYLLENDLLDSFSGFVDIVSCFPTNVPKLLKELQDSSIDNDEIIEQIEVHYDITYCDSCNEVLNDYDGVCDNLLCDENGEDDREG
mgnify:CR=1 FL=1